jgi:tetratricopeptide (TPR) repeat protein
MLVTPNTLNERIADTTEWIGRAHDSMNEGMEALSYLKEARQLYADLGKVDAVARIDDKIGEIGVQDEGDLDAELQRVRKRLEGGGLDILDQVKTLIQLGELLTKAGDDFEAKQPLLEAERILAATPNMSHNQILKSLVDSIQRIMAGTLTLGENPPIVQAMQVRSLYQRLYFALGNVFRDMNPAKAKEYEEKLAAFDDRGGGFDANVVSRWMEQLAKGFGGPQT